MKEREYTFDVLRVIAMIMVIIIHVSNVYTRSYNFIDFTTSISSIPSKSVIASGVIS